MPDFASREKYQSRIDPGFGYRIGVIGTSLVQHNDVATASKVSHWSRGWLSWARVLSRELFSTTIWHDPTVYVGWEPSGTAGATRFYRGLNAGVSGQTSEQVDARKSYLNDVADCDIVVVDAGTNDISTVDPDVIHGIRTAICDYYLNRGKIVILLPILARGISSWGAGSVERRRANYINSLTRDYVRTREYCYLFDWNAAWVDTANANGEPRAGFSPDGIHFTPLGAYEVGKAFATFLQAILPYTAQPRVWSQDDLYNATDNPRGNLLSNPFMTGTGGAVTNATGTVATGMRVERTTGTSTVVASKETRPNNRGDYQVVTITPGGTGENLIYVRTSSADLAHTLPAGTWVQASAEVDVSAYAGYRGITMFLNDQNVGGLQAQGLEPWDNGTGTNLPFPTEAWSGVISTPRIQLNGSGNLRWRVEIRIDGAVAGSPVVKVGAVELRPVANPRDVILL